MNKPLILVTNDDGIGAPGIRILISIMREIGEVIVMAPKSAQSGMAHAITVKTPLRVKQHDEAEGYKEYSCNGTPVDCVKLAEKILSGRKPDLLVSGINHGSNASINIIYSGTMAAALEAAIDGIPSIGFSLLDYSFEADFEHTLEYIKKITENVLKNGMPKDISLNVNFPSANDAAIKGVKVCRQARAYWDETYEEREDPRKRKYYWLTGKFNNLDDGEDTDEWALSNNYVSIVPVQFDFTAYHAISIIKKWEFDV